LQPHDRIMLVTSSPCQDLTVAGTSGGRLGFTGKQSSAFHAVHLLLLLLQSLNCLRRVFIAFENAGSMLDVHKQYYAKLLGLSPFHLKVIDSGDWSVATRKRLWCTSSIGIAVHKQPREWQGTERPPLPLFQNKRI
jgi:site-specific DNA-cytosine methylase